MKLTARSASKQFLTQFERVTGVKLKLPVDFYFRDAPISSANFPDNFALALVGAIRDILVANGIPGYLLNPLAQVRGLTQCSYEEALEMEGWAQSTFFYRALYRKSRSPFDPTFGPNVRAGNYATFSQGVWWAKHGDAVTGRWPLRSMCKPDTADHITYRVIEEFDFEANRYSLIEDEDYNPFGIYDSQYNVLCIPGFICPEGPHQDFLQDLVKLALVAMKPLTQKPASALRRDRIKLGMDVEFSIVDSDMIFHSATEFVADSLEAEIGTDGNVETLEIRPEASPTPSGLYANYTELLEAIHSSLPKGYDIWGGGGADVHRSTGVHLHVSGISTDHPEGRPEHLVEWLDVLIGDYLKALKIPGWNRGDPTYGARGDYRNAHNHHGFPHKGFEYRVLPSLCINPKLTQALLELFYIVVLTYETEGSYEFDENRAFGIHLYERLTDFDKYRENIEYFVKFFQDKNPLNVPILREWFQKEFKKDAECDMIVTFRPDPGDMLNIANFVIYNPQKLFNTVQIWMRKEGKSISLSSEVKSLERHLIIHHGLRCIVKEPPFAVPKNGLTIGLPAELVNDLRRKSHGSRNMVKMFCQDIARAI